MTNIAFALFLAVSLAPPLDAQRGGGTQVGELERTQPVGEPRFE